MITDPRFPGASITIPAGVTITGWDGTVKTKIALERLSPDALPVPPPPGETRSLYQVYFGTPMGGLPSAVLPVTVPNDQDLDPGDKAEIWYYDAAPIPGVPAGWRLAGLGTVSADGSQVVSDPGVGISRFCGVCGVFCIIKNLFKQAIRNLLGPTAAEPVDLGIDPMPEMQKLCSLADRHEGVCGKLVAAPHHIANMPSVQPSSAIMLNST